MRAAVGAEQGAAPDTPRYYTNDEPGVPRERLIVRHPDVEEPALRMRTALDEAPIVALSDYHLSIAAGPRNPWAMIVAPSTG